MTNHTVAPCPICGQKLRIPTDRGDLNLTCPKCRRSWNWPTKPVDIAKSKQQALAPVLIFQDSEEFYQQLSKMFRAEDRFTVQTPYKNYDELPNRLKKIFKSAKRKNVSQVAGVSAKVSALTKTPGALKIIIGATSFGAAAGLGVGTLLSDNAAAGAFAGTLLGLLTGSVAAAISQGSHQVEIEVDVHGRILFRFHPVKAARRS
jgi:hypothetical protein